MSRQLFRSVFRNGFLCSNCEFSPMSSLAESLETATIYTPCKRLSLSSQTSDSSCDLDIPADFDDSFIWPVSPAKENRNIVNRKRRRSSHTPLRQIQNHMSERSPSPRCKKVRQHDVLKYEMTPDSPLDKDSTSRDSGYSESETKIRSLICLPKPILPKFDLDSAPPKVPFVESPTQERKFRSFASLSTTLEEDQFLMELVSDDRKDKVNDTSRPMANIDSLLNAPLSIDTPQQCNRLPIRRCLSMVETPVNSRKMSMTPGPLAVSSPKRNQSNQFKRPCSPDEFPKFSKRKKLNTDSNPFEEKFQNPVLRPTPATVNCKSQIQRCVSESHLSIMKALNKSDTGENLTGDFSRTLVLPILSSSRHPELRSVSADTLAQLLRGAYKNSVDSFKIIDCRYPYEYEGGHVAGAENWPSLECASKFFESKQGPPEIAPIESGRKVIIFHCEFSAERGPRAQRYLREADRTAHKEHYPALHFPELYLLEGGYQGFFRSYPELCTPHSYTKMLDVRYSEEMKLHRSKSRTFATETKFGKGRHTVSRTHSSKRIESRLRHN